MNPIHALYTQLWQIPAIRGSRLGRHMFKQLAKGNVAPAYEFLTDFFGLSYRGELGNSIDFNIFYYGAFEKPLLFFLSDTLEAIAPHGCFADIGANIGQHSLYMSRLARQVHAFEPYQAVRDRLQLQIQLNALENITVHPVGLSDRNTSLPFFAPTGRNTGIGSFDASTVEKGNRNIGELQLVNGDDYFRAQHIEHIDLMKIDVEGFEKPALHGLASTLRSNRPIVVCEITYNKPFSFESLSDMLAALPENYSLFTFDTRKRDGSKARRRNARTRLSGNYRIIPYQDFRTEGQDDIIACPNEALTKLPRSRGTEI
ncbi:MAG: FkbM family methyltransferase [Pseudomonadales bacterium]|nr:FkbM family methyltransferase [Pseudomonadales bacterium]